MSELIPNRALKHAIEQSQEIATRAEEKKSDDNDTNEGKAAEPTEVPPATISMSFSQNSIDSGYNLVSIIPANISIRGPVDICCVVDVSGSMNNGKINTTQYKIKLSY